MANMKIKKGDTVVVLSGKDKGKQGKVQVVIPSDRKVVVEGVNIVTCHTKPRRQGCLLYTSVPISIMVLQKRPPLSAASASRFGSTREKS